MMKKKLMLAIMPLLLLLSACGEDEIVDYVPVVFYVTVTSDDGSDMLSDADFVSKIVVNYKDKDYTPEIGTRAYAAFFRGAWMRKCKLDDGTECNAIAIGEWAGDKKWYDEKVTVRWPNGTQNVLSFTLKKAGVNHAKYSIDGYANFGKVFSFGYDRTSGAIKRK